MLELINNYEADLANAPQWVRYWLDFMGFVMILSIPFSFVRREAIWVLVAFIAIQPLGVLFYSIWGFQKILGASHLLPWIPLAIYLWTRRARWQVRQTWSGKWLAVVFCTICVSLVFDITDTVRFLLGHRI